jgi:hypothetical protein
MEKLHRFFLIMKSHEKRKKKLTIFYNNHIFFGHKVLSCTHNYFVHKIFVSWGKHPQTKHKKNQKTLVEKNLIFLFNLQLKKSMSQFKEMLLAIIGITKNESEKLNNSMNSFCESLFML